MFMRAGDFMTAYTLSARPAEVGRLFYLVMLLIMVAIVAAGFSQTVPDDFAPTPGLPLLLHVHGAVFTCWAALMIVQPSLVVAGNVRRHIQLGVLGAVLAAGMVVMAVAATLFAIGHHFVPVFFPKPIFLVQNIVIILVFAALFTGAFALRHQAEWHKRLMYCACASIISPGLGRFLPMDQFGAAAPLVLYGVNDLVLLAGPIADLVVRRRVHPAYLWGLGALISAEIAIPLIAFTPPVVWAVKALGG